MEPNRHFTLETGDEITVYAQGNRYGWYFSDCIDNKPNAHFRTPYACIDAARRFCTKLIKEDAHEKHRSNRAAATQPTVPLD